MQTQLQQTEPLTSPGPDELRFGAFRPAEIDDFWPYVEAQVARACEFSYGRFSADNIYEFALQGIVTIWAVVNPQSEVRAVVVTQQTEYPTGLRALEVMLVGGENRHDWLHFESKLEEHARREGCHVMQMYGRRGWERDLKHWRVASTLMERRL